MNWPLHKSFHFLILSLLIMWSACKQTLTEDQKLNSKDLALVKAYEAGDSVFFKSNLGDVDTFVVVEIIGDQNAGSRGPISTAAFDSKSILISHLPHDRWAGTHQTAGEKPTVSHQSLISLHKSPQRQEIDYTISYRNFVYTSSQNFGEYQPDWKLPCHQLQDAYKLTHSYPERLTQPEDISIVYWTAKQGLTAYVSKAGECWSLSQSD